MPRKDWIPKQRKRGYRRFLNAPRKDRKKLRAEGSTLSPSLPGCPASFLEFCADCRELPTEGFLGFDVTATPGINVVSLFDGIGAARVSLDRLGIKINNYFSSEIDKKAISVLKFHYHDSMTMVGCVKTLTEERLDSFGDVQLLMGGSPCEDLSICNPSRRGIDGEGSSAPLFYEFKRILDYLTLAAKRRGHMFYYLFENTAAMETSAVEVISGVFGHKPFVRYANQFVPMKRKRYFWSDLPGMCSTDPDIALDSHDLQDYLAPYRTANVKTLPTITTTSHSQRTGKEKKYPVTDENGNDSLLLMTEEEKVFGFDPHYTDVSLSITDRRKLMGKSWCIPVVVDILRPFAELLNKKE